MQKEHLIILGVFVLGYVLGYKFPVLAQKVGI